MLIKYFIGLVAVYLVGQADPNLELHAFGLYLVTIGVDILIYLTEGIRK